MLFERSVGIGDVCLMMFAVMDLHGTRIDVRRERVMLVWKIG
jgi:hypothetical protein